MAAATVTGAASAFGCSAAVWPEVEVDVEAAPEVGAVAVAAAAVFSSAIFAAGGWTEAINCGELPAVSTGSLAALSPVLLAGGAGIGGRRPPVSEFSAANASAAALVRVKPAA